MPYLATELYDLMGSINSPDFKTPGYQVINDHLFNRLALEKLWDHLVLNEGDQYLPSF